MINQQKLKTLCISQELSERMKELGYPQNDSLFYWMRAGDDWILLFKHQLGYQMINGAVVRNEVFESNKHYAAPTAGEIELPRQAFSYKGFDNFICQYRPPYNKRMHLDAEKEVEVRGLMWVYLKKQGLL